MDGVTGSSLIVHPSVGGAARSRPLEEGKQRSRRGAQSERTTGHTGKIGGDSVVGFEAPKNNSIGYEYDINQWRYIFDT